MPQNPTLKIKIRPADISDAAEMKDLLNEIIDKGIYTAMVERITLNSQKDFIHNFPSKGVFLVAQFDEKLIGLQDVSPDNDSQSGFISTFVKLEYLRKGVGAALTAETLKKAKQNGFKTITAVIRNDNLSAQLFYSAMGFTPIQGIDNKGKSSDQTVLMKIL